MRELEREPRIRNANSGEATEETKGEGLAAARGRYLKLHLYRMSFATGSSPVPRYRPIPAPGPDRRGFSNAVPPRLLGGVESGIGRFHQFFAGGSMIGIGGHARADGDRLRHSRKLPGFHHPPQLLRHRSWRVAGWFARAGWRTLLLRSGRPRRFCAVAGKRSKKPGAAPHRPAEWPYSSFSRLNWSISTMITAMPEPKRRARSISSIIRSSK